jgi:hypothetical protein
MNVDETFLVTPRARPAPASKSERMELRALLGPLALLSLAAVPLPYLARFDHTHALTAAILGLILCAACLFNTRGGIIAAICFLAVLGDYRRYAAFFQGYPSSDPLLLVGPAAAAVLLMKATLDRGRAGSGSLLSRLILVLMLLMVVSMFNPLQGGIQVGVAGALFYLAPLLWFWVGRLYASEDFFRFFTFRVLLGIGVLATLWGLYQTEFGLLGFEQQWAQQVNYAALQISNEVTRQIGFFTSSAEYQRCLLMTAAIAMAAWLTSRSLLGLLVPVVGVAIFLSAARGPVVFFVLSTVVMWAVSARSALSWAPRFIVASAAGGAVLVGLLVFLSSTSLSTRVAPLVNRQVEGLLDPTNPEKSTAAGHAQLILLGLESGFTSPAGLGLGATTIAASKYGGLATSTEFDLSNVMVSLGILGGVLYEVIVAIVFFFALRWWSTARSPASLAMLGICVATFGAWLIGGEYSMVAIAWFCIGSMDRLYGEAVRAQKRQRKSDAHRVDHT